MAEQFDAYRKWLGIPPAEQPANHYRLLGLGLFENDPDSISNAADRQMAHVRTFQSGPYSTLSQRLLNELIWQLRDLSGECAVPAAALYHDSAGIAAMVEPSP